MVSPKQVLANLDPVAGRSAHELAKLLGCHKSDVNPHLYRLLAEGTVHKDDLKWFLTKPKRAVVHPKPIVAPKKAVPSSTPKMAEPSPRPASNIATPSASRPLDWTDEQKLIINAPASDRVLVEAGPGTGKTAVACARVAKLLRADDITPSSILMISFTRTAVAEMKNRIRLWDGSGRVNAVQISTLDQAAFSFGVGCGEQFEHLMNGFEGNIQNAVEQFQNKNPLLTEYLNRLNHVIIDEAQDLTGSRSQLVRLMVESLPKTAGVTIFADQAQSIYGFTTDLEEGTAPAETFLQSFDFAKLGFKQEHLETIHRTHEPLILKLFAESRKALLDGTIEDVLQVAESLTECLGNKVQSLPLRDGDLVLYRKRASALMDAQYCPKLFRLRLPNHPPAIYPWIGLVFCSWTNPIVSESEFSTLWEKQVPITMRDGFNVESAWALLRRFSRERDHVKLSRLRSLLSRPRPPVEFCFQDYGGHGPIFSTIHASKGREADRVFLMLPNSLKYLEGGSIDPSEEARVFYVGSTRAKSEFLRGKAKALPWAARIDTSGRRVGEIISINKKPKFQFGLAGDLDDAAPVSRNPSLCASDSAAMKHQKALVENWTAALKQDACPPINATCEKLASEQAQAEYRFRFMAGSSSLAWSAAGLNRDLWKACEIMKGRSHCGDLRPPDEIPDLRLIGLRTCAVSDDPVTLGHLREPFASSGFWLAPMIVGFPSIFLRFKKSRS
jgi:hypothetical protein